MFFKTYEHNDELSRRIRAAYQLHGIGMSVLSNRGDTDRVKSRNSNRNDDIAVSYFFRFVGGLPLKYKRRCALLKVMISYELLSFRK